jgi:hypothetical protein
MRYVMTIMNRDGLTEHIVDLPPPLLRQVEAIAVALKTTAPELVALVVENSIKKGDAGVLAAERIVDSGAGVDAQE